MSYINPIWLEHQRKRFTRPDAWRFAPPGSPEAKPPGWLDPSATRVRLKEAQEEEARARAAAEQDAFEREVEALRAANARVRIELADVKFALALRRIFHKYSPDQPRDERGRWTDSGGGATGSQPTGAADSVPSDRVVLSDASPDPIRSGAQLANVIRVCTAGTKSITLDPWGNNRNWWVEYTCADGFSFIRNGFGGKIPGFVPDPRR